MRIMGIDYGLRRVGVAISDDCGIFAMPVKTIETHDFSELINEIKQLCRDLNVEIIVVGLPINMNGSAGAMSESVLKFADTLTSTLHLPVNTWDERLSTTEVERVLVEEADMSRKKRKKIRDKLAAQVILQGYLDALQQVSNDDTEGLTGESC